jgi:hypothetical protein
MTTRQTRLQRLLGVFLAAVAFTAGAATVDIAGTPIDETVVVGGQTLTLNGAGFRKRGYFKVDVTALYMQGHYNSIEAIEKAPGAKRLQLVLQQDITGAQASRYFLTDFEASAQPMEFAQLINEVSQVGGIYSSIRQIKKGDIVNLDVVPGKGVMASLNGTPLVPHGAASAYFANELLGRVLIRMYIVGKTPQELRDNLLGLSTSMRTEKAGGEKASERATAASGASKQNANAR